MFDLPEPFLSDPEYLADWVELCTLVVEDGQLSRMTVSDVFSDSGLFEERVERGASNHSEELNDNVWAILDRRCRMLGEASPFELDKQGGVLVRKHESWTSNAAFTFLMLLDLGHHYSGEFAITADSEISMLFERVVREAQQNQLKGSSSRFGWKIEPGWPTGINDRISQLADDLNLEVENLEGKTNPHDKDRGLDIACRLSLGDDGPGSVTFLTQCAIGKHWRTKRGEPSFAEWQDLLVWNSTLIRAIAVPWRLSSDDLRKNFRHFDAVVWDRFRLCHGHPDKTLKDEIRTECINWCRPVLDRLPRLTVENEATHISSESRQEK